MTINRKLLAAGVAVAVLAVGGIGIAYAVGGDSDEQASGPDAEKAKAAAIGALGGGEVVSVERSDDGDSGFEVEIRRDDGSQVEVQVDARGEAGDPTADDDAGEGSDDGREEDD